ncbi:MAG: TM2 domain-containing protein [Acholeplasmataceae bacterium]|nr:TM2 domain-containing protein [Acholeplasmataceae bacterium]
MSNYVTSTSDKSKKKAFYLCLFGGWLGLHNFYVGRLFRGTVYMFTLGLFGLGWALDFLSIIFGAFKDNVGAPLRQ